MKQISKIALTIVVAFSMTGAVSLTNIAFAANVEGKSTVPSSELEQIVKNAVEGLEPGNPAELIKKIRANLEEALQGKVSDQMTADLAAKLAKATEGLEISSQAIANLAGEFSLNGITLGVTGVTAEVATKAALASGAAGAGTATTIFSFGGVSAIAAVPFVIAGGALLNEISSDSTSSTSTIDCSVNSAHPDCENG